MTKLWQHCVNEIFNPYIFLFLLTCATWYFHDIYIKFRYFASCTGYEDDIFEGSFNLQVQRCKFSGKVDKFGQFNFFNELIGVHEFHGVIFPQVW